MSDDDSWKSLPLAERALHSLWKARMSAYTESTEILQRIDSEELLDDEFGIKKIVEKACGETNVLAFEIGLDTIFNFLKHNPKYSEESYRRVIHEVIFRAFSSKPKTAETGNEIIQLCIENEMSNLVIEELLVGCNHKNPKVINNCILAFKQALCAFGSKVVPLTSFAKDVVRLASHRDKNVRESMKSLFIEMYKWGKVSLIPLIQNIPSLMLKDLESEFELLAGTNCQPTRFTKSEAMKNIDMPSNIKLMPIHDIDDDTVSLITPVDIQLPNKFHDRIEEKKWIDRKEVLDELFYALNVPKLNPSGSLELSKTLRAIIQNDTNAAVVETAVKCVYKLANALQHKYSTTAPRMFCVLVDKFSEKRPSLLEWLRNTVDLCFKLSKFEFIVDDCFSKLSNKSPSVKVEAISALVRVFNFHTYNDILGSVKSLMPILIERLDDAQINVRDNACKLIANIWNVVGESPLEKYLSRIDKLKIQKIKTFLSECVPVPRVQEDNATTAPAAKASAKKQTAGPPSVKPLKKKKIKKEDSVAYVDNEIDITYEEVTQKLIDLIGETLVDKITSIDWRDRMQVFEKLSSVISPQVKLKSLVFIKALAGEPLWKENNLQVIKLKFETIKKFINVYQTFSKRSLEICVRFIVDKICDTKLHDHAVSTLNRLTMLLSLPQTSNVVLHYTFVQKNPKSRHEVLLWLGEALKEHGFEGLNSKYLIEKIHLALMASQSMIRQAAVKLIGITYTFIGDDIVKHLKKVNPSLLSLINSEIKSVKSPHVSQPKPTETTALPSVVAEKSKLLSKPLKNKLTNSDTKVKLEGLNMLHDKISKRSPNDFDLEGVAEMICVFFNASNSNLYIVKLSEICIALCLGLCDACNKYLDLFLFSIRKFLENYRKEVQTIALRILNNLVLHNCPFADLFGKNGIHSFMRTLQNNAKVEIYLWLAKQLPKNISNCNQFVNEILPEILFDCDTSSGLSKHAMPLLELFVNELGLGFCKYFAENLPKSESRSALITLKKFGSASPEQIQSIVRINLSADYQIKRERLLKCGELLKWNNSDPTREHVSELRHLFSPVSNHHLLTLLFDSSNRSSAIAALQNISDSEKFDCYYANIDLILKWVVLRLYDLHQAHLVNLFQFVIHVFRSLTESAEKLILTDDEVQFFFPFLLMRCGDECEQIRKYVHDIVKVLARLYPSYKMFPFILCNLTLDDVRRRLECLALIEFFVHDSGPCVIHNYNEFINFMCSGLLDSSSDICQKSFEITASVLNLSYHKYQSYIGMMSAKARQIFIKKYLVYKDSVPRIISYVKSISFTPSPEKKENDTLSTAVNMCLRVRNDLSSSNIRDCVLAIKAYIVYLRHENVCVESEQIDLLVKAITDLINDFKSDKTAGDKGDKLISSLLSCLNSLFNTSIFYTMISKETMNTIVYNLSFFFSNDSMFSSEEMKRLVNVLIFRILENSFTTMLCSLMCLLQESLLIENDTFLRDFNQKCLWKALKMFPQKMSSIDCTPILKEAETFFRRFPFSYWEVQTSDVPLRTVKTFLNSLAKEKYELVCTFMESLPNSEFKQYLKKILARIKVVPEEHTDSDSVRPALTRTIHKPIEETFGDSLRPSTIKSQLKPIDQESLGDAFKPVTVGTRKKTTDQENLGDVNSMLHASTSSSTDLESFKRRLAKVKQQSFTIS